MTLQFAAFPDIKTLPSESFGTVRTITMQGLVLIHKCPVKGNVDFDELHIVADVKRSVVKVDRQKLLNLLLDHSVLLNACGSKVKAPPPKVRRERLSD